MIINDGITCGEHDHFVVDARDPPLPPLMGGKSEPADPMFGLQIGVNNIWPMGPGPPASPHREKPCKLGRTNSLRQDSLRNNFCLFISGKRILLITLFINLFSLYNFLSLLAKFFMKNTKCRQMSADVGNVDTVGVVSAVDTGRHSPTLGVGGGPI